MATLQRCPTCGNSVSSEAPACPRCGQPLMRFGGLPLPGVPPMPPRSQTRVWLGLFLLVSFLLAPAFPGYTLSVGTVLLALVVLYLFARPLRHMLGDFLRVSA